MTFPDLTEIAVVLARAMMWFFLIGIIISGGVAAFINISARLRSASRYNILVLCLLFLIISFGYFFFLPSGQSYNEQPRLIITESHKSVIYVAEETLKTEDWMLMVEKAINFISPYLVILWIVAVVFKLVRLRKHHIHADKISCTSTQMPLSVELLTWFGHVKQKINVENVQVRESSLITAPLMHGSTRPVICLPKTDNGYTDNEIKSILLHELAHIKRSDYLFNYFQNFLDSFFFFSPGYRWLSSLIKMERENCCDDLAVSIVGDNKYAHSLVNIYEKNIQSSWQGLNFFKTKYEVGVRVHRLLLKRNLPVANYTLFFIFLTSLPAVFFLSAYKKELKRHAVQVSEIDTTATTSQNGIASVTNSKDQPRDVLVVEPFLSYLKSKVSSVSPPVTAYLDHSKFLINGQIQPEKSRIEASTLFIDRYASIQYTSYYSAK